MPHDDAEGLGLADAISQVRGELERAIEDGRGSGVAFKPGPVELEFEIGFGRVTGVDGGFRLSVLAFGAKHERSAATTHRIRVSLTPVDRHGREGMIADIGEDEAGGR